MSRAPRHRFPPPSLITTTEELQAACCRLRPSAGAGDSAGAFVTVDTEFIRERTYWPELCVVQLGGADEVVVIDAQAPGLDLTALGELLADQTVTKVFHAARQDVEIFNLKFGAVPHPLFDRQGAPVQRLVGPPAVARPDRLCRRRCHLPARDLSQAARAAGRRR